MKGLWVGRQVVYPRVDPREPELYTGEPSLIRVDTYSVLGGPALNVRRGMYRRVTVHVTWIGGAPPKVDTVYHSKIVAGGKNGEFSVDTVSRKTVDGRPDTFVVAGWLAVGNGHWATMEATEVRK